MITAKEYQEMSKKKSKYGSTMTTVDGVKFRSKKESEYYKQLVFLKKIGEVKDFTLQPRFPYEIHYLRPKDHYPLILLDDGYAGVLVKKGSYISDFKITYRDGRVEYVDTKGFLTPKFKRDKQIVEALYGIKIKVV
jgi:hypothetical protein